MVSPGLGMVVVAMYVAVRIGRRGGGGEAGGTMNEEVVVPPPAAGVVAIAIVLVRMVVVAVSTHLLSISNGFWGHRFPPYPFSHTLTHRGGKDTLLYFTRINKQTNTGGLYIGTSYTNA